VDNKAWSKRRKMAREWHRALCGARKQLGIEMLPIAFFSATGRDNANLPDIARMEGCSIPMRELLSKADIVLALTQFSATAPLMAYGRELGNLRGASMPGVTRAMEATALAADYQDVARRAAMLVKRLGKAETAAIDFTTGHTLHMDLRFREAEADAGQCPPGIDPPFINLPSGDAYQAPYEGERPDTPSRTRGEIPVNVGGELVVLIVEENRIREVVGKGPAADDFRATFEADPARRNVAEIGLGCNPMAVVSGNVLEDEKAGFHWAYGRSEHLGGTVGPDDFVDASTIVHFDIVYAAESPIGIASLRLEFPEGSTEEIMRDKQYTIF
jgi:leucyl aminopeptidase (aminopeptidase T)